MPTSPNIGILAVLGASSSNWVKGMTQAQQSVFRLGSALQSVGIRVSAVFGAPMIGAIVGVTKEFIKFESAFAGVKKTVEGNAAELAKLEKDFINLTKVIPMSAAEIAKIGEAVGQLGVPIEQVAEFTKVAAELGATTNLSGEEAAKTLFALMKIMQPVGVTISDLGDAMVHLGNKFAATEAEISEFSVRLAGAGSRFGLTATDVLALSSAMADLKINAEAGGTAMSRVMDRLLVAVASGGKQLQQFNAVVSHTGKTLNELLTESPREALMALFEGLGKTGGAELTKLLSTLFGSVQRVGDVVSRMAGASKVVKEAFAESMEAAGARSIEFAKRLQTTESQIQLFKNAIFRNISEPLGREASGAIRVFIGFAGQLVDWLGKIIEAFNKLPTSIKLATAGTLGLVAASGPLMFAGGLILQTYSGLIPVFVRLAQVIGLANKAAISGAVAFKGFGAAAAAIVVATVFYEGAKGAAEFHRQVAQGKKEVEVFGATLKTSGSVWAASFSGIVNAVGFVVSKLQDLTTAVIQMSGVIPKLSPGELLPGGEAFKGAKAAAEDLAKLRAKHEAEMAKTPEGKKALMERAKEALFGGVEGLDKEIEKFTESMTKGGLAQELQKQAILIEKVGGVSKLSSDAISKLGKQFSEAAKDGVPLTSAMKAVIGAMKDAAKKEIMDGINEMIDGFKELKKVLTELEPSAKNMAERGLKALSDNPIFSQPSKIRESAEELQKIMDAMGTGLMPGLPGRPEDASRGIVGMFKAGQIGFDEMIDQLRATGDVFEAAAQEAIAGNLVKGIEEADQKTSNWTKSVRELSSIFKAFGIDARSTLGSLIGSAFLLAEALPKAFASMKSGKFVGGQIGEARGVGGKVAVGAQGIAAGIGAIGSATASGSTAARTGKGALAGAAVGAQYGGVAGAVVGAIAGAVTGFIRGRRMAKLQDDIANALGTKVSEALAKGIKQTAKDLKIDIFRASLLNLGKAFDDVGGVAKFGLEKATKAINDLFNAFAMGKLPTEEGLKAIGEAFTKMVDHLKTQGTKGSVEIGKLVSRMQELGIKSAEMQEFVKQTAESAVNSFTKFFDFLAKDSNVTVAEASANVTVLAGAFAAAVAATGSLGAAVALLPESFGTLIEKFQAVLGSENAAFNELARFYNFAKANQEQLEAIAALGDGFKSLIEIGIVNKSNVEAFAESFRVQFESMLASTSDQTTALAAMGPQIALLLEAFNAMGVQVPPWLTDIANKAKEAGASLEPPEGLPDILKDIRTVLLSIAEALGAVSSEAGRATGALEGLAGASRFREAGDFEGAGAGGDRFSAQGGLFKKLKRDTLILAHAGELAAILPKDMAGKQIAFATAQEGFFEGKRGGLPGERRREQDDDGIFSGGGDAFGGGGGDAGGGGAIDDFLGGAEKAFSEAVAEAVPELARAVATSIGRPQQINVEAPTVNIAAPTLATRDAQQHFDEVTLPRFLQAIRKNQRGVLSELKTLLED